MPRHGADRPTSPAARGSLVETEPGPPAVDPKDPLVPRGWAIRAAIAAIVSMATFTLHVILSFMIGVHWPILLLWFIPLGFIALMVIPLGFSIIAGKAKGWRWRRETRNVPAPQFGGFPNWRWLRPLVWYGTLSAKIIGITVAPVLATHVWVWDVADVCAIATTIRVSKRERPAPYVRWTLGPAAGREA